MQYFAEGAGNSKYFRKIGLIAGATMLYAALTLISFYPQSVHMSDHVFGGLSDVMGNVWGFHWAHHSIWTNPMELYHANRLYPMEYSYASVYQPIAYELFFGPVYELTHNQLLATNITIIAIYALCGTAMFLLLYHWTGSLLASFLAGCLFAFSPMRYPADQVRLLGFFWTPLVLLFADRYLKSFKPGDLLLCTLFALLQILTSIELGYFLFFILAIYLLCFRKTQFWRHKKALLHGGLAIAAIAIILAPFFYPYMVLQNRYGFARSLGETMQFSADPLVSYLHSAEENRVYRGLMPVPEYSPLPGEEMVFKKVLELVSQVMGEDFVLQKIGVGRMSGESLEDKISYRKFFEIWNSRSEKALFQGFLAMIAGVFGIRFLRRQGNEHQRRIGYAFLGIMLFAFILSLGPVLVLYGHLTYIPLPYLLFYYVMPGFSVLRGVYRFAYMISFALSVLGGFGFWYLDQKRRASGNSFLKSAKFQGLMGITFVSVIMAESWCVPYSMARVPVNDDVPHVYRWLARQDIKGAVFFIPTIKGSLSKFDANPVYAANRVKYTNREIMYLYYSTYHFRKMVNGLGSFMSPEWQENFSNLYRLPDSTAVAYFKTMNIRTFVLFTDEFEPEDALIWTKENISKMGFAEIYRDEKAVALQLPE